MMGGMMTIAMAGWTLLGLALLAVAVAGGIWAARHLARRRQVPPVSQAGAPPGLAEAQAELTRMSEGALPFLTDPSRKMLWEAQSRGMPYCDSFPPDFGR